MITAANGKRANVLIDGRGMPYRAGTKPRTVRASYDAARNTDEFDRYWANADTYDADSANSKEVRQRLVSRSRYETNNNGYADGIAQTYATDLIGRGPSLRMQTLSEGFNNLVENEFSRFAKAIKLRRKLWTLAHAKYQDGEGIGVIRRNDRVRYPIPLDLVLYETEQCQTPFPPVTQEGRTDGVQFDQWGNPTIYEILLEHPGQRYSATLNLQAELVPAEFVCHWLKIRRPGQHRGVPEATSTLNAGAGSRRWREATLGAAETAAEFSVLLKTAFQPEEVDELAPMSKLEIEKRMMTALPGGWEATQMRAEHPSTTYSDFMRSHISEQARPKSMPFNKAAADSSSYNYASGRLDHQTYYASLDVDRDDCDEMVLDVLFDVWWPRAIATFGWLGGNPAAVSPQAGAHSWDWPRHQVADLQAEANSIDKRLRNGSLTLSRYYADEGLDFADSLVTMSQDYGVSPEEMQQILVTAIFNAQNQQASMAQAEQQAAAQQEATDNG